MITAFEAARAIGKVRKDALVVATMTPNRYWDAVTENKELDLPIFGAMGKASSVALGLALARPDKKVIVLDGDGALLMNLGTLVTIAGKEPHNLVHFVFDDGVYFTTGGQPVPGGRKYNLAGIARESGIKESFEFDNLEDLVSELPAIMEKKGPVFVCLKVAHGDEVPPFYMGSTKQAMRRLSAALGKG
ncbi:MAG: thiamine pyrophosphate-dependent enzyme, partial [Chloroflexi bacterium]|nr:thiamine pyrophosphate-dependent enzyme [Chloroflexota bacterium]